MNDKNESTPREQSTGGVRFGEAQTGSIKESARPVENLAMPTSGPKAPLSGAKPADKK